MRYGAYPGLATRSFVLALPLERNGGPPEPCRTIKHRPGVVGFGEDLDPLFIPIYMRGAITRDIRASRHSGRRYPCMKLDRWVPSSVWRLLIRFELELAVVLPVVLFFGLLLPLELVARRLAGPDGLGTWLYWEWAAFALPTLAFLAGYLLAIFCLVNLVEKVGWRRLMDQQRSGEDIRALPWHEFERFVAAAFASHGWKPEIVGKPGPDGGVDIRMERKKEKAIVQCKQRRWQQGFVGERDVREFAGILTAEKASKGFFVTSGFFSPEAVEFAAKVPKLELVAADDLFEMLGRCKDCGSEMIYKDGRHGGFMSCARYPECRGSADIPAVA